MPDTIDLWDTLFSESDMRSGLLCCCVAMVRCVSSRDVSLSPTPQTPLCNPCATRPFTHNHAGYSVTSCSKHHLRTACEYCRYSRST